MEVLIKDSEGAAPFSFFNAFATDPPMVGVGAISSSLNPYILPPAEFASIQKGHPTLTAMRSVKSALSRIRIAEDLGSAALAASCE